MKKTFDIKLVLFNISVAILMLTGFCVGITALILLLLPLLKKLGPDPNLFIVLFVVTPALVVTGAIVGYLGIILTLLLWKPFLNSEEARKIVFEPYPDDTSRIILILVKPYYKMARLIYPDAENGSDSKREGQIQNYKERRD